jgi:hypothetical protein
LDPVNNHQFGLYGNGFDSLLIPPRNANSANNQQQRSANNQYQSEAAGDDSPDVLYASIEQGLVTFCLNESSCPDGKWGTGPLDRAAATTVHNSNSTSLGCIALVSSPCNHL